MTNPDYTALLFVIDHSGSMVSIARDMEGGIAALLEEQGKLEGKVTVDIAYFDTKFDYTDKLLPVTAAAVKITPRGSTALNDAIVRASTEFGQSLAEMKEEDRPGKVLVVVVTDGHENASIENTVRDVKTVIETQQNDYSWEYVFLGANQDAVLTASEYGIRKGSAMTYDTTAAGVRSASAGLSEYTTQFRSGIRPNFSTPQPEQENIDPANIPRNLTGTTGHIKIADVRIAESARSTKVTK